MKSKLLEYPVVVWLFNVWFPNFPVSHDLSRQGVLRQWQNRSRIPQVEVALVCVHWSCKGIWEETIGVYQRGDGRVLNHEHFLYGASVFIYEDIIFPFKMEKMRCDQRIWVVYHLILETILLFLLQPNKKRRRPVEIFHVYYESIKRELNKRLIFDSRCDARLKLSRLFLSILFFKLFV